MINLFYPKIYCVGTVPFILKAIEMKNVSSVLFFQTLWRKLEKDRSSRPEVFCEKVVLKNFENSQESTCARVSFLIKIFLFIKKEVLAHVFSCKFCEILRNTLFYRTPLVAASKKRYNSFFLSILFI